jgi:signal transduction histidine kinase
VNTQLVQTLRDARATLAASIDGQVAPDASARVTSALGAIESVEAALSQRSAVDAGPDSVEGLERRVAELSRAVTLHDEFLSTLGHELRNPLAPIFMQAQYLLDAVRQGESKALSREWLEPQLEAFCRRLQKFLEMLTRIMDLSRMSAGQLSLELEEFDMVVVVREVAASVERELAAARCDLTLELPPHLTGVWDRLRIEQISSPSSCTTSAASRCWRARG